MSYIKDALKEGTEISSFRKEAFGEDGGGDVVLDEAVGFLCCQDNFGSSGPVVSSSCSPFFGDQVAVVAGC